jgi:hypothetical protein
VILDDGRLRCGVCQRRVGVLKFDAGGWPHPFVMSPLCPGCGREQFVDYAYLEDATLARYQSG